MNCNLKSINGKKILILGLGITGKALALRFRELGAIVRVSDSGYIHTSVRHTLIESGIDIETEGHTSDFCLSVDIAFISPGISDQTLIVSQLKEAKIPCFDELDWVGANFEGKIIAVTGSVGKSTTVTWIYQLLQQAQIPSVLCGNIGVAACSTWQNWHKDLWMILEVSSFQAERLKILRPDIAILTNFYPNHLDRHSQLEAYKQAKQNLFRQLKSSGTAIVHEREQYFLDGLPDSIQQVYCAVKEITNANFFIRDGKVFSRDQLIFDIHAFQTLGLGEHNLENFLEVLAVAYVLDINQQVILDCIPGLQNLPHRLEWVAEIAGRNFYNDSKSTSAAAVTAAIKKFQAPIVLILGGQNKKGNFSILIKDLKEKVSQLILMGQARHEIRDQIVDQYASIHLAPNLREAIWTALRISKTGDVILLSPGCASFDEFSGYQERGKAFIQEVLDLQAKNIKGELALV